MYGCKPESLVLNTEVPLILIREVPLYDILNLKSLYIEVNLFNASFVQSMTFGSLYLSELPFYLLVFKCHSYQLQWTVIT